MEEHDRGADRAEMCAAGSVARMGARATTRGRRTRGAAPRRRVTPAVGQRTIDELRQRLAAGSLVPDPARIARALLGRGVIRAFLG